MASARAGTLDFQLSTSFLASSANSWAETMPSLLRSIQGIGDLQLIDDASGLTLFELTLPHETPAEA